MPFFHISSSSHEVQFRQGKIKKDDVLYSLSCSANYMSTWMNIIPSKGNEQNKLVMYLDFFPLFVKKSDSFHFPQ